MHLQYLQLHKYVRTPLELTTQIDLEMERNTKHRFRGYADTTHSKDSHKNLADQKYLDFSFL